MDEFEKRLFQHKREYSLPEPVGRQRLLLFVLVIRKLKSGSASANEFLKESKRQVVGSLHPLLTLNTFHSLVLESLAP